jgi:peptidyl-prolyl cis-trans isomerase C
VATVKLITVNDEPLDPSALEQEFQAIKAHYESLGQSSCCGRDEEFRGYAREHVLSRVLIHQEADRQKLALSEADITEALEQLYAQHGGREAFYINTNMSETHEPDVRADLANSVRLEKTLRRAIGPALDPTAAEVRAAYEARLSEYMTEEEARATHILKKLDRNEERAQIYDGLRALRARAKAGEDFATLAAAHTDKEDGLIDLGWFKPSDFMDEFGVIAFSLDEGEISPVFASYFGFHLAQCTGRRPAAPKPFEEVAAEIRQRLISEDQQAKSQAWVETLKAAAKIEERDVAPES